MSWVQMQDGQAAYQVEWIPLDFDTTSPIKARYMQSKRHTWSMSRRHSHYHLLRTELEADVYAQAPPTEALNKFNAAGFDASRGVHGLLLLTAGTSTMTRCFRHYLQPCLTSVRRARRGEAAVVGRTGRAMLS